MKLTIELVPSISWFTNLRSLFPKEKWDKLRKTCYKKANYRCEVCGGKGNKWPVECHEIWEYDDTNKIQKLTGLTALCPSCHEVKHIGLAKIKGNYSRSLEHLCKVNNCSSMEGIYYIEQCFKKYKERSKYKWKVDISIYE